jgi:GR25 family glycosyltransferase involved in LPS biosynthesis
METLFETWMIVYCNNLQRVEYYNKINKQITTNFFPAIDCINQYNTYSDVALDKNYCTIFYKKLCDYKPGKLGCNLSHQMLLEMIQNNSDKEWNLVLEDDVTIDVDFFMRDVNEILQCANSNDSLFIQLYTHPKFISLQSNAQKFHKNLYKMSFQWGTCAYLIHKTAIKQFIQSFPLSDNIDIEFGKNIKKWKAMCWLHNGIKTDGALDHTDLSSKLGSIIYQNK